MRIKLQSFPEHVIKIDDGEFTVKEMDYSELATASLSLQSSGECRLDLAEMVNLFIKKAVKGWKNIVDENGNEIPFTGDNRDALPFEVKQKIFNKIKDFSTVSETEKKN